MMLMLALAHLSETANKKSKHPFAMTMPLDDTIALANFLRGFAIKSKPSVH